MNTNASPDSQSLRIDIAYLSLFLVLFAGVFYLFRFQPVTYLRLISEDQWGEYATVVCFFLAAIHVLKLAWNHGTRSHKVIWTTIGVAFLFICGEELSWGQRIFQFETPEFLLAGNTQGELTIHNLKGGYTVRMAVVYLLIGWSVVSIAMAALAGRNGDLEARFGIPLLRPGIVPLALGLPYFEIVEPVYRYDEIGELFLAVTALVWAFDLSHRFSHRPAASERRGLVGKAAALLAAAACASIVLAETMPRRWHWKWELHLHAMRYLEDHDGIAQAEDIFRYLQGSRFYILETRLNFVKVLRRAAKDDEALAFLEEARDMLEESIAQNRDDPRDMRRLGSVYRQLGETALANDMFDEAIAADRKRLSGASNNEERARIMWSIAETLAERGDAVAAKTVARDAIAMADSEEVRTRVRRWLKSLD